MGGQEIRSLSSTRLGLAEILGAYPSHPILACDKAPPTVFGEQLHPQFTGRPFYDRR